MTDTAALLRSFEIQAGACAAYGSPFSAQVLTLAAADIAVGGPTLRLLAPWSGATTPALIADAVPLRLLAGLHDLALNDTAPALSAVWPGTGRAGDAASAWLVATGILSADSAALAGFMAHEPQTNEVRRSACLLPGFLTVAQATGLPLRCFEIAASAGLNLLWDQYRYQLGAADAWGDPGATVIIDTDWRGPPPPTATTVAVIERAACDRQPVDLRDPEARRRLRAYVWADQPERLTRLDGAIAAALAANTVVEAADAVDWTRRRVAPVPGAATVLYHSVFWSYMSAAGQVALTAAIQALGDRAAADAPFAWLRMEPAADNLAQMELRLTLWPGGEDRRLAICHPHGAWVEWD